MHKQVACLSHLLVVGRCFYISLFLLLAAAQPPAKTVPSFRFTTHDHHVFTNADLPKGKLLLFVFFDPDCEHCQHALRAMDQKPGAYQHVDVYLVSMASWDKIDLFAATYAPKLAAQKNVTLLSDETGQYIVKFSPIRYPSLYLYQTDQSLLDYEDNENTLFRIEKYTH
jgi:peroxiredoxin